jgi:hypothetical protein
LRKLSAVVILVFVLSVLPSSGWSSIAEKAGGGSSFEYLKSGNNLTGLTAGTIARNISHSINVHVVFVGYNKAVVNTSVIDANIGRYYELPYWDAVLKYTFRTDYAFADQSYLGSLKSFILQHSVTGVGITSALNVTALEYQLATGNHMSIFLPQSGRAIDAEAMEQWFEDNPYVYAGGMQPGYTFYILNFTEFNSADHSWEHWYNVSRYDLEAKSINDYWRLEWDNSLNPNVKFPCPAFTSKYPLLFIDPSAFQWYLTWARIWWELDPYIKNDPKYDYYYEDLGSFLASHNVATTNGKNALGMYLAGWIDDFLYNLLSPVVWPSIGNKLSLQVLVLNNVSQYGYTNEKMKWIINSTLVEEAVKNLAPFMQVDVSVKFENLSLYPEIENTLNQAFIEQRNGWNYYDGYGLFYALESARDQYFNMKAADITVNSYVFLLKNASFETGPGGMEFTGLGGYAQVLILKSIDRYFRPDGVTPKSGLGTTLIHELGHNLGFPHTFSGLQYAGDFAEDVMGYYSNSYSYSFSEMRTDLFRRTLVDMKLLELKKALRTDVATPWPWPRKTLVFRNSMLDAIKSKINQIMQLYDNMDYLGSYYKMIEVEDLEAYVREVIMGIKAPGDINSDGKCDRADLLLLLKAYGSTPSSPTWNPSADLNKDGKVNFEDYIILKSFFGQKAKVTVSFFNWKTEAKATTIDYGFFIYPQWYMPYSDLNMTYGLQNWDKRPRIDLIRISQITMSNLIESIDVKIYNQTTTIAEITWSAGETTPTNWTKLMLAPSAKYTIMIEVTGTNEANFEMSVITLESRELPLGMNAWVGK